MDTEKIYVDMSHDYKGFTIDQVIGGYIIVLYGRKYSLYFSGPRGLDMTEDVSEAKTIRTIPYCYEIIDEVIKDHDEWIKSISNRKVKLENECI